MVEKKTIRKVISGKVEKKLVKETESVEVAVPEKNTNVKTKKSCFFCQSKTIPTYTDIATLKRFVTDRSKITPRAKTYLCSKHQRAVTRNIKYARHLSLLSFTPKV